QARLCREPRRSLRVPFWRWLPRSPSWLSRRVSQAQSTRHRLVAGAGQHSCRQSHAHNSDCHGVGRRPVAFGLVKSLSRPGGNITGLTNFAEELASKQIDLMREFLPRLTRLAALINVENPLHVPQWRETQAAAAKAAISLVPFEFHSTDQLEAA